MQYKTTCSHCGREYMVDGNPGDTIRAICPYCGTKASIVTPAAETSISPSPPLRRKSSKPMFLRVTLWFLVIVTILFVILTIMYFVFTGMSK